MSEFLELTYEKFTLRVATDRFYSKQGLWFRPEDHRVRIGLSDFLQQRSGDVAFAEIRSAGQVLKAGDELVVVETIKVSLSMETPLAGKIIEVNPLMETSPEIINQDPYNDGWLVLMEPENWDEERLLLLDPQAYYAHMQAQIAEEM